MATYDSDDTGISLQEDMASVQNDKTFHNVILVCSDNMEISASDTLLAARSKPFKAMFFGKTPRVGNKNKFHLTFRSDVMHAVIQFIHTSNIAKNTSLALAVETYRAATYFKLPGLMQIAVDRIQICGKLNVASSLLNEAISSVPPSEKNTSLYEALLKPFCAKSLLLGDLKHLKKEALEYLLKATKAPTLTFKTTEHDLLLCVIDWTCDLDRNESTVFPSQRADILEKLKTITTFPSRPEIPAKMTGENLRKEFYQMMNHIDTSLICPHRFANLVASIDALSEAPQYVFWVPYLRAYPPGRCPPNHPSGYRGKPHAQWDRLALGADLVVYDDGAVVEYPMPAAGAAAGERAARMSQPIVLEDGDKVTVEFLIRSSGAKLSNFPVDTFGFVGTSSKDQLLWKVIPRWILQVDEGKVHLCNNNTFTVNKYGRLFVEGDVISFYIDCRASTCSIAINGTTYGTAFTKLPAEVYFTAILFPQASYRLRMY